MKRAILLLILAWYALCALVSKPFLPWPHVVLMQFASEMVHGTLAHHLGVSALRIGGATVGAAFPATLLGMIAGRRTAADRIVSPFAYILYPVPKVALLPVIMLLFGLGDFSKIFLISLIIFFQLFFVVRDATRAIDERSIDSVKSLGATGLDIARHVVFPAVLPFLFTALRVSTGTATAVLFLAETFATVSGLGWYIMDAWARTDYPGMYAGMTALSLLGSGCFMLFSLASRALCPWKHVKPWG